MLLDVGASSTLGRVCGAHFSHKYVLQRVYGDIVTHNSNGDVEYHRISGTPGFGKEGCYKRVSRCGLCF